MCSSFANYYFKKIRWLFRYCNSIPICPKTWDLQVRHSWNLTWLLTLTGFQHCLVSDVHQPEFWPSSFSSRDVPKIRSHFRRHWESSEADGAIVVLFKSPVGSVGSVDRDIFYYIVIQMGTTPDILLIWLFFDINPCLQVFLVSNLTSLTFLVHEVV